LTIQSRPFGLVRARAARLGLPGASFAVVAWIWLQQVIAARGCSGDFYDGKRQAARYYA
jgi:hypothetical protein